MWLFWAIYSLPLHQPRNQTRIYLHYHHTNHVTRQEYIYITIIPTTLPDKNILFTLPLYQPHNPTRIYLHYHYTNHITRQRYIYITIIPTTYLKFSRTESMMQAEDTSQKDEPPSTIHRGSTMMSNRPVEGGREPMKQKEGSTMKKLSPNTMKL